MKAIIFLLLTLAIFSSQTFANDSNFLGKKEDKVEETVPTLQEIKQDDVIPEPTEERASEATNNDEGAPKIDEKEEEKELTDKEEKEEPVDEGENKPEEIAKGQEKKHKYTYTKNSKNKKEKEDVKDEEIYEKFDEKIVEEKENVDEGLENLDDIEDEVCPAESPEEVFEFLTPEQQAYKEALYVIPPIPEDFQRIKLKAIKNDKTIMKSYSYSIPSFLLKGIAAHHKFVKSSSAEEKELLLKRGFLMPGPYMLDLVYIFRKQIEDGYIYIFGVVVNRCVEKACETRPFPCKNTAYFSSFEPLGDAKRKFLDWKVEMAPEGYMKCPNFVF